jgi:4-alpha-glucanotransferase
MADRLNLLMAVHNHQPVGNFQHVFERAFRDCYGPFFRVLERHPRIKLTVHFSGPLLEAMAGPERECAELVAELVRRGQIEMLGGGFYEPILTIIPEADRQGQLRLMSDYLEESFGTRPRGIWLTERVWEPGLPKTLAAAGIEYTLLDEEHFRYAGAGDTHRIYITEDEGRPLRLFPIDKRLRYLVPFRPLEEISRWFDVIRARGGLAILGDDGEKFGMWPGTREWVYDRGWLEEFLAFLESDERIETRTFSEALDAFPPEARVYLPPASYEEMMEWVLEPEAAGILEGLKATLPESARPFLRGGFFRQFFLKYPEVDHLHKRMLGISRRVLAGGDDEARRELYRGQCNDPYWHGVFGGLYLPHLREAAYDHLLRAERMVPAEPGWQAADEDADGRIEVFRRDDRFGLRVKPAAGGAVTEIDYFPLARNLGDVLSRRRESYHTTARPEPDAGGEGGGSIHELRKELPPEAERLFRYDRGPRLSGVDHFLHPETRPEDFRDSTHGEQGDFAGRPYAWSIVQDRLFLTRKGTVLCGGVPVPVSVQKVIRPEGGDIHVICTIVNLGDREAEFWYAGEWNFYQIPEEFAADAGGASLAGGRLRFSFEPARGFWHFPLQTLSQSEKGFDVIHQGFCLLPHWHFRLAPQASFSARFHLGEDHPA